MRNLYLLLKKELKRYFNSPIAYVILIVFLLINGWMFASNIFLIDRMTIQNFTANIPLILIFFAPAVAMQLLAEEFKDGTMEILGSLPIKDREIILGKYLAGLSLLALGIVLTLLYPLSISFFGNMDWGQVMGVYTGMLFLGATFLSFGTFGSSVSNNQVVSFIIGFAICFVFFIMGKITQVIPEYIRPVVSYMGIDSHWENLSRGVIDLRDIVYFLSLITFFIYGSWVAFGRRVRIGFYNFASLGLLGGILIFVNILASGIVARADLTDNNIYSLSDVSKKIVKNLDDPVLIEAYFSKNLPGQYEESKKYLKDLLYEYRAYSKRKVKFDFINPQTEKQKREAMSYGVRPLRFTESGRESFEIKQGYMGLVFRYADKKEVIPVVEDIESLEYDLTSRIKKITSRGLKRVGFSGDFNLPESVRNDIEERYEFVEIEEGSFKKDSLRAAVLKAGSDFDSEELNLLEQLAENEIPVGVLVDNYTIDMERFTGTKIKGNNINQFLSKFGISIKEGLILDRRSQRITVSSRRGGFITRNIVNYPYFPRITGMESENPIVRNLDEITLPFVSPLEIRTTEDGEFQVDVLARTSGQSGLDKNPVRLSPMQEHRPGSKATGGPFDVAAVVKKDDSPFRMVIVPTSKFIDEDIMATENNIDLFLNIIDWMAEDPALISIRSKGMTARPMKQVSSAKETVVKYTDILLLPILILGIGIYRWRTRKLRNLNLREKLLNE
ncbi:MAG: Gldg family protein [Elusimicrobiota bacterium]